MAGREGRTVSYFTLTRSCNYAHHLPPTAMMEEMIDYFQILLLNTYIYTTLLHFTHIQSKHGSQSKYEEKPLPHLASSSELGDSQFICWWKSRMLQYQ